MDFDGPGWVAFVSEDSEDLENRILVAEDWCGGALGVVCEAYGKRRTGIADAVACDLPERLQLRGYSAMEPHMGIRIAIEELHKRVREIGLGGMVLSLVHVTRELVVVAHVGDTRAAIVGDGRCDDLIREADRLPMRRNHALGSGPALKLSCEADIAVRARDPAAPFLLLATTRVWPVLTDNPVSSPESLRAVFDRQNLTNSAAMILDLSAL